MMQQREDPTKLSMRWTPQAQELRVGSTCFVNEGETTTYPSHDLTHLLVAASSDLEWNPDAEDKLVRLAEYNAVMLDILMSKVIHNVKDNFDFRPSLLGSSLKHMRWFVYKQYRPFPIEAEEAYCRFCNAIDADTVIRLSPVYFDMRLIELERSDFMKKDWSVDFYTDQRPETNELTSKCQDVFGQQINRLVMSANRSAVH